MSWALLIGVALIGWTLLLLIAGERQRRINEAEAGRQQDLKAAITPVPHP